MLTVSITRFQKLPTLACRMNNNILPTISTALVGWNKQQLRPLQTYKLHVPPQHIQTIKDTLPLVAEAGEDFTKHFYKRMFNAHPSLLNVFNQTNQVTGGQPKKLLKTVAVAAQAALQTQQLPQAAIESICHKHAALHVTPDAYNIVGEHLLGTIQDLLTSDQAVLDAWAALYGDIVAVFVNREKEITEHTASIPGAWTGRRNFALANKEQLSSNIVRFRFEPTDGKPTPVFTPGQYTTIWVKVDAQGAHGRYTEQPRHYTLNMPRQDEDATNSVSISVKKQGLVSTMLHDAAVGTNFELSAPFGCFDMSGAEKLWLAQEDAPVVFLSAGVGITPVLAMLENIYVTRPATWLHASIDGGVHAYRDRLREIAAVRTGELQRRVWYENPASSDGEAGGNEDDAMMFNLAKYHYKGRMDLTKVKTGEEKFLTPELLHLENQNTNYYMCGPPGFMDGQMEALKHLGVDEDRIHYEGF